jgi:ribosome-binding protein aMBF1 (putative translation factor)
MNAIMISVAEVELHDEVVRWLDGLNDRDWDRTVVIVDRLADLGSQARMPLSRSLGEGCSSSGSPSGHRTPDQLPLHRGRPDHPADHSANNATTNATRSREPARPPPTAPAATPKEKHMANYSRWTEVKGKRPAPSAETRAGVEQDLALGQLIYDLRTDAGLSQRQLAERMGTTQSVISRLEEGGGARNRIDTLARVATALNRHLVLSFPEELPAELKDAVQVA